jgi:hypothetical protein
MFSVTAHNASAQQYGGMEIFEGAIYPTGRFRSNDSGRSYYSYGSYYSTGNSSNGSSSLIAQSLNLSCYPNTSSALIGEAVVWFSTVSGGTGSYTYFWGGSDELVGNAASVAKVYTAGGTKTASLTVISGNQSLSVNCTRPVTIGAGVPVSAPRSLGASCYAPEERIAPGESGTWVAVVTGLNPAALTLYSWDGTDTLSGSGPTAFKTYTVQGKKYAVLTVTNGNVKVVSSCTNQITVAPRVAVVSKTAPVTPAVVASAPVPEFQALCSASATETSVGKQVVWSVSAIGGAGSYTYTWTGDEELSGSAASTSKIYKNEGVKKASATVISGEKTVTVPCAPIEVTPEHARGLFAGGFFTFSSPVWLGLGVLLAAIIGIYFATRRRRAEEAEEAKQ